MKKLAGIMVCLVLVLATAFGGCKSDSSGKTFRYDIPGAVENLDPQFATDSTARIILGNLLEGLLVQSADGTIQPGVAKSHTISADKRVYTFHLRKDAAWSDNTPVTAEDFVFAFHRMFAFDSPFAANYSMIMGAEEVLAGQISPSFLEVKAVDNQTLRITLEHPDPFFLERLCDPAAAPCNQTLFDNARGRFGLELGFVPSNGPFFLEEWNNEKYLLLRQDPQYQSERPTVAGRVNFYIDRDASSMFLDGKSDVALLSYDQQEKLENTSHTVTPVQRTVWCIVFNQNHAMWGNPLLRQGLAHTVDHQAIGEHLPIGFRPTSVLVPGAVGLMGTPYRESAFAESPLRFDTRQGQRLFDMGLSSVGREQLPSNTIIHIPEILENSLNIEVQQVWQKYLSAYINFTVTSPKEIQNRFYTGDYQMLVMPFTSASADVSSLLGVFTSDSGQNHFGYQNVIYDELYQSAANQPTIQQAAEKYAQAEAMILNDAVVIPLYFETTYLAVADRVQDLEVTPFGDRIYFKYARKDG